MYLQVFHIAGFTKVTCRKYKLLNLQNSHKKNSTILKSCMKRKRMVKKQLGIWKDLQQGTMMKYRR
jgi:hypothetical protein